MSIDLFFSGILIFSLLIFSGFIADHLYGVFAMKTNQWNRHFLQSMLLGLLLMFFGLFVVDSTAAEPELRMGVSTYSDFKEIVPDQSEGDFGQKLKELTEKTAAGKNSGYWRERPWTSSSIFRLMWVTPRNIQDIISLPTSIIPYWM